jgi:hypothetical protein
LQRLNKKADHEEGAKREAKWRENGYTVISMKNDFKTIYGYGVQKVNFTFPED